MSSIRLATIVVGGFVEPWLALGFAIYAVMRQFNSRAETTPAAAPAAAAPRE